MLQHTRNIQTLTVSIGQKNNIVSDPNILGPTQKNLKSYGIFKSIFLYLLKAFYTFYHNYFSHF